MTATSSPLNQPDLESTIRSRRSPAWNRAFPEPLNDAKRRFWTLRDGGYAGPIDQDGYRVDDDPFNPIRRQP